MASLVTPPFTRPRNPAAPDTRATPPVPRLLYVASLAVIAGAAVMAVVGALRSGVTWDEPYHVMRMQNFLDRGWFALDWSFDGQGPASTETNTVVYAPVTMLLLHGLGVLVGVEGWDTVAATPAAYELRHLGIVLIGLVGTGAAAATTRILLGSWRWAAVTAAALLALPMWTGHLMFNIKDVPVATGYTLVTLALVLMVAPVRGRPWHRIACLVAGIVLMVGTRPGMWTAVVIGLLVLAAGTLAAGRFGNARTALAEAAIGVCGAGLVLAAAYPNVFTHPLTLLLRSAEQSAQFRGGREEQVVGYVPFFVLSQVPWLLLAFAVIGVATAVGRARAWRTDTSEATRLALVGAQLLALPLVAVAKNSDLYNALRQLLFTAPAWAILVTVGIARVIGSRRGLRRPRLAAAVAAVALVAPVVDQVTLFPYQYTYYNAALDTVGVHVPTDYWRSSVAALLPSLPTDGQIVCGPTRTGPGGNKDVPEDQLVAGRYSTDSSADCRTDPLGPLAASWEAQRLPVAETVPHDRFYAIVDRDHPVPRNCVRLASVDRDRHGRTVTMTYVARCQASARPLGDDPVVFSRADDEAELGADAWAFAPEGWVMRATPHALDSDASRAALTFAVPGDCTTHGCDLVLDADAPADLRATVNDFPAGLEDQDGAVLIRLEAGTTTAWVELSRGSGLPLDLRLRSLRIAPITP